MSVDVRDFRKLQDTDKMKPTVDSPKPEPLVQKAVDGMQTGDENLDKLIRVLTASIEKYESDAQTAAVKVAGAFQDHLIRVCQFEYMYFKGKVDGLKEAANIPLQIMAEKKLIS